jgi:hypothetical protein
MSEEEEWLEHAEAVALVRSREPSMSTGRAERILADAWRSSEVRRVLSDEGSVRQYYSEPGLIDWLKRNRPSPPVVQPSSPQNRRRYANDNGLVAEAVKGIENGTWPNAYQAAQALAPRAEGTRFEAKSDRLGRKIGKRLRELTPEHRRSFR